MTKAVVAQTAADPPHSDDSEIALLHSLMNGCDLRGAKLESLEPQHFYRAAHGWVYGAMLDLDANGQAVDVITLTERLKERDENEFLIINGKRGEDALKALAATDPGGQKAVRSYAKTIRTKHTRRMMLKQAQALAQMALDESVDPGVQITRHERALATIRPFDLNQEFVLGADSYARHVALLKAQAEAQVWHEMPWDALTARAPVLLDGDIAVIVGPEGSGKSALLAQWAQFEAGKGNRTVYIHTEMNDKAVFDRRAVNASRKLRFTKLQKPDELNELDWIEVHATQEATDHFSRYLDYWNAGIIPEARLFTVMQHLVDTFGMRTFVIDYLNDVEIERQKGATNAVAWRAFMARCEAFNNRNHTVIITAAQLNKDGEAYEIGRALRQKAMLYLKIKPEELTQEYPFRFEDISYKYLPGDFCPIMRIAVEKYRGGGRGVFDLLFVGPRYLWTDVPEGMKRQ
jgi:replicative DNA helicase